MKKFKSMKGFICGLLVGSIGITSVFAAGGIKSAVFNSNKVILDGKILDLGGQQMISVVKDGETNASNYMPVRGVLEAMGYIVDWDGSRKAVIVSSGGSNNIGITDPVVNTPTPTPAPVATPVAYYDWEGIILSLVPDYGALVGVKENGSAGWANSNYNNGSDPSLHVVEISYPTDNGNDVQKYKEILIKDKFIKQEITSNTATLLGIASNLHNNAYDLYKKGDVSVAISQTNNNLAIFIVEPFNNSQINTVPTPQPTTNNALNEGQTYTYYENGVAMYSLTLKKSLEEAYKETQIVNEVGMRILQVDYTIENIRYDKDIGLSNSFDFVGINENSYSIKPETWRIYGYTRAMYEAGLTSDRRDFKDSNANKCPTGSKSTGKLLFLVGDSKTLEIRCKYTYAEGLKEGVTWKFTID